MAAVPSGEGGVDANDAATLQALRDDPSGVPALLDRLHQGAVGEFAPEVKRWLSLLLYGGDEEAFLEQQRATASTVCRRVFADSEIVYECHVCRKDNTCCICAECFRNSNHDGHEFKMVKASEGGVCDCGDVTAWAPEGFCAQHQGHRTSEEIIATLPPSVSATVISQVLAWLLQQLIHTCFHDEFESTALEREFGANTGMFEDGEDHWFNEEGNGEQGNGDIAMPDAPAAPADEHRDDPGAGVGLLNRQRGVEAYLNAMDENFDEDEMMWDDNDSEEDRYSMIDEARADTKKPVRELRSIPARAAMSILAYLEALCSNSDSMRVLLSQVSTRLLSESTVALLRRVATAAAQAPPAGGDGPEPPTASPLWAKGTVGATAQVLVGLLESGTPLSLLDVLILCELHLPISDVTNAMHRIYIGLLADPDFKLDMGRRLTRHYKLLVLSCLSMGRDAHGSTLTLTVQIFTLPQIVPVLIAEENAMQVIIDTLYEVFQLTRSTADAVPVDLSERLVDVEHPLMIEGSFEPIVRDLQYLVHCAVSAEPLYYATPMLYEKFLQVIEAMQGLCPIKRRQEEEGHVEYESDEWYSAALLTTSMGWIITPTIVALQQHVKPKEVRAQTIRQVMDLTCQSLDRWIDRWNLPMILVKPVSIHSAQDDTPDRPEYTMLEADVSRCSVFVYLPLHFMLSQLYLFSAVSESLPEQELLHARDTAFYTRILEHPLEIFVMLAQTRAGLWSRNGDTHLMQVASFYTSTIEIFLQQIQVLAVSLGAEHLLTVMLHKSNTMPFMRVHAPEVPALAAAPVPSREELLTMEDFFMFMIVVLTDRGRIGVFRRGKGERVEDLIREEVIHLLATGELTYSQMRSRLTQGLQDDTAAFERVLGEVAVFLEPHAMEAGRYALKEACWAEFNPYHLLYQQTDREVAKDRYRAMQRSSAEKARASGRVCTLPVAPIPSLRPLLKAFLPLNDLAVCPSMIAVIYCVVQHAVSKGPLAADTLVAHSLTMLILAARLVKSSPAAAAEFYASIVQRPPATWVLDAAGTTAPPLVELLAALSHQRTDANTSTEEGDVRALLADVISALREEPTCAALLDAYFAATRASTPSTPQDLGAGGMSTEERRAAMKARQLAVMEEFRRKQNAFSKATESPSVSAAGIEQAPAPMKIVDPDLDWVCCLCHATETQDNHARPPVLFAHAKSCNLLRLTSYGAASRFPRADGPMGTRFVVPEHVQVKAAATSSTMPPRKKARVATGASTTASGRLRDETTIVADVSPTTGKRRRETSPDRGQAPDHGVVTTSTADEPSTSTAAAGTSADGAGAVTGVTRGPHDDWRSAVFHDRHATPTVVHTCGHVAHYDCFESHFMSLYARQEPSELQVNIHAGEYVCPVCSSFCNSSLPLLPAASASHPPPADDEDDDGIAHAVRQPLAEWMTAIAARLAQPDTFFAAVPRVPTGSVMASVLRAFADDLRREAPEALPGSARPIGGGAMHVVAEGNDAPAATTSTNAHHDQANVAAAPMEIDSGAGATARHANDGRPVATTGAAAHLGDGGSTQSPALPSLSPLTLATSMTAERGNPAVFAPAPPDPHPASHTDDAQREVNAAVALRAMVGDEMDIAGLAESMALPTGLITTAVNALLNSVGGAQQLQEMQRKAMSRPPPQGVNMLTAVAATVAVAELECRSAGDEMGLQGERSVFNSLSDNRTKSLRSVLASIRTLVHLLHADAADDFARKKANGELPEDAIFPHRGTLPPQHPDHSPDLIFWPELWLHNELQAFMPMPAREAPFGPRELGVVGTDLPWLAQDMFGLLVAFVTLWPTCASYESIALDFVHLVHLTYAGAVAQACVVSEGVDEHQEIRDESIAWDTISRGLLAFLRRAAMLMRVALPAGVAVPPVGFSMPMLDAGRDKGLREVDWLLNHLGLPAPAQLVRQPEIRVCMRRWFQQWAARERSGPFPLDTVVLSRFAPFRIVELPTNYQDVLKFGEFQCAECKTVPSEPAICLSCGAIVCVGGDCCTRYVFYMQNRLQPMAEGTTHAAICSVAGAYLLIRHSTVLLVRDGAAAYYGSLYLDQHGEPDPGLHRGMPLQLHRGRFERLQQLIVAMGLDNEICRAKRRPSRHPHFC